ncbi:MAG: membrane protein insertion efficiency factor YidD [Bacteroidetes bacterium]|nr:membrane protein insertion efficiency factor YidD [Bacteroidota bacterium]
MSSGSPFPPSVLRSPASAKESGNASKTTFMREVMVFIVRVYQAVVSPLLPPNTCRFTPTCSQYAVDAFRKYGVFSGGWRALKRIGRCHPFHPGGFDPA